MADNYLEKKMEDLRSGKLLKSYIPKKRCKVLDGKEFHFNEKITPEIIHRIEELRRQGATVIISGPFTDSVRRLVNIYGAVYREENV